MRTPPTSLNNTAEDLENRNTQAQEDGMIPEFNFPVKKALKEKTVPHLEPVTSVSFERAVDAERNVLAQEDQELKPRITVVGVGGAGGNAVNNMIRLKLQGVDFVVCNTDAQAIGQALADRRIRLGLNITQGLGAGSRPEVGRAAAEESLEELIHEISGSNMIFITAGMGGGTGTGAAPVIAQSARELGILTVAVVTKPFHFEGNHRMRTAEKGIEELQQHVDTLIVIPNQNLFRVANEKTTFADAFKMADDVLYSGVRGVTDLMMMPGLINLDFADIRAVMGEMGKAMMGTGEAEGDNRAISAAEAAISNPLLDDVSMKGARGVLINITGGPDMTLFEVDEAANRIREEVDPDANIIFGSTFDESLQGRVRVSVVATGIDAGVPLSRSWSATRSKLLKPAMSEPTPPAESFALEPEENHQQLSSSEGGGENSALSQNLQNTEPALFDFEASGGNSNPAGAASRDPEEKKETAVEEDFFYFQQGDSEPQKEKRKGFLSRFADKIRGGRSSEDSLHDEAHYPLNTVSVNTKNLGYKPERDQNEMLDIPSYLRRKNKN